MQENKYEVKANLAVGFFLFGITGYMVWNIYLFINHAMSLSQMVVYLIFLAAMWYYFMGCRPYQYVVGNREVVFKKRLFPDKHLDLMKAEVITDAVPRMADLVTRPHAIEIYDDAKKRFKFFPKDVVGFTGAVLKQNKRIHCNVAAYTDANRHISRRNRRARRKA